MRLFPKQMRQMLPTLRYKYSVMHNFMRRRYLRLIAFYDFLGYRINKGTLLFHHDRLFICLRLRDALY